MHTKRKEFFDFGVMSTKGIIKNLFFMGILIIVYRAFLYGKSLYLTHFYEKMVKYTEGGDQWYTTQNVNNPVYGILGFIIYAVVFIVIWKLICEIIYIIINKLRYDEDKGGL